MSPSLLKRLTITTFVAFGLAMHTTSPLQAAAIDVYITAAPPTAPAEAQPPGRPGYVWAPGYYAYRGTNYVWIRGEFIAARPGYIWVADRWEEDRGRYRYHPGHWSRH
jgi:hypothetical protein